MKILIIDRDELPAHMIKSRLEPLGHTVEIHPDKGESMDAMLRMGWDVVFIDPSPLTNLKPLAMQIRRSVRSNVYMVLLSNSLGFEDAIALQQLLILGLLLGNLLLQRLHLGQAAVTHPQAILQAGKDQDQENE